MVAKSTKSLVINILGRQFPLTLKQIFNEVKIDRNISYQAVHKAIKELVGEDIIEKIDKQYFLNKCWIEEQTNSFSDFYSNYFSMSYNSNQIDRSNKIQIFRFTSIKDTINFIIEAYTKGCFDLTNNNSIYFSVRKLLPFIPQQLLSFLKELSKKNKINIICKSNTISDKWVAKLYRILNVTVKVGVDIPHYNSMLIGDCVLQYFFFLDDSYRKRLYSYSEKIKKKSSMSLLRMTSDLIYKKTEIYLVLNRHPVLVENFRESVTRKFNHN
jgi:hypothetical protein